jgi:hypothetical protein
MAAVAAVSPELVLVDPDLAAALRATAVPGPWRPERRERAVAPNESGASSVRRMTTAALAALLALLLGQGNAGTPERVDRRVAHPLLPPIAAGRTDAAPRPLPPVVHRVVRRRTPTVTWSAVRGASYYDLVLWRDGRRVLDLWPRTPRQALATLVPGRYLWFAYPGFGSRAAGRFGPLAASGSLVVRTRKNR